MANIIVDTKIWQENEFDLTTGLTYLWLKTNGIYTKKIGLVSVHTKIISFFTGLEESQVKSAIIKLKEMGLVDYDGYEILLLDNYKIWSSSICYIKSLYEELNQIKSERLKELALNNIVNKQKETKSFSLKREIVFDKFNGRCAYCGELIDFNDFHIDHIHPRKMGGANDLENYNPACVKCNLEKANRTVEEYRFYLDKTMKHKFYFEKV